MRSSDWSSDVCSSDLYDDLQDSGYIDHFFVSGDFPARGVGSALMQHVHGVALERGLRKLSAQVSLSAEGFFARHGFLVDERQTVVVAGVPLENSRMSKWLMRSEEHTSELQSLMRISYDVFCLKKKK